MIKYFKELLATLKSIDKRLAVIEENSNRLNQCVKDNSRGYGNRSSISTSHWNDN